MLPVPSRSILLTFVPQPSKNPVPAVVAAEINEFGPAGYDGSNDGANKYTGAMPETMPAIIGIFSELGLIMHPDNSDEIPNTEPLCRSKSEEPWKSSKAPSEVFTGVNIISIDKTSPV